MALEAWPLSYRLLVQFAPSEQAKAAGAPVEVDISNLKPGDMMTVEWRGKPVWIINRTTEMLADVKKADDEVADPKSEDRVPMPLPEYCNNEFRSLTDHKNIFVRGRRLHASGLLA